MSFSFVLQGSVQGVGMRPFIYTSAHKFGINGRVRNSARGVELLLCESEARCEEFLNFLQNNLPPLAKITHIKKRQSDETCNGFEIINSCKNDTLQAVILPDSGICEECKAEFYDAKNRRYHHLFINCTNCGARYSIIEKLPYDRENTTMGAFNMCESCKAEYTNAFNRRYHAQPIACNECGPRAFLRSNDALENGVNLAQDLQAIKLCAQKLREGKIIAFKGIGGFHLMCNAQDTHVVKTLRERKIRPHKPLAIMCKDIAMAEKFAHINTRESALLHELFKPIVLVKKRADSALAPNIAPELNEVGIFLAPSALHLALFLFVDFPLVATSANVSAEPIIARFEDLGKLHYVWDYALDYDREICNPSDESIAFVASERVQWIRQSRGIKPEVWLYSQNPQSPQAPKGCFLALGAELKNTFVIYKDGLMIHSPYIGDLKTLATQERFFTTLECFKKSYGIESFDFIVADLHPHFSHTRHFERLNEKILRLQHHYAHILSVMGEYELESEVLGFAFDGTGYGEDSHSDQTTLQNQPAHNIWGGEVLRCDRENFTRLAHFEPFALIGGEKSLKNINHLALSILEHYKIPAPQFYARFEVTYLQNLLKAHTRARLYTSSLGRIFDAFASLVCGLDSITFEAQAPMRLESLYDKNLDVCYDFSLCRRGKVEIITYRNVFEKALIDKPQVAATGFINGIAKLIATLSERYKMPAVLSGGVFQNKALIERTISNLESKHLRYYIPHKTCTNDSAIALGQAYYGISILQNQHKG
ncbi:carbamoyltransferase HypF [Helicobacter himalayensis]